MVFNLRTPSFTESESIADDPTPLGTYKHKTIERKNPETQLRIFACFHRIRNIPAFINLIEASRGTEKREGLCVYAMHLMELSERSSAILMVHKARTNGLPFWNKGQHPDNQVVVAFEAFRQLSHVSIRPMTVISSMSTIHEDICESAERKRAAVIIMPFHKHQRLDGAMETTRNDFRCVNRRVLEHAPCTVGILVDRGLGGGSHVPASAFSSAITVLFFGGPDDREALAYGGRMAEHPGINLSVVRFIASPEIAGEIVGVDVQDDAPFHAVSTPGDEMFLSEFRNAVADSIKYEERRVKTPGEVIDVIKEFSRCNLFLVGRRPEGQIAAAMSTNGDTPELGPVGSLLSSSEFSTSASVLVVQQYAGRTRNRDTDSKCHCLIF